MAKPHSPAVSSLFKRHTVCDMPVAGPSHRKNLAGGIFASMRLSPCHTYFSNAAMAPIMFWNCGFASTNGWAPSEAPMA